MRGTVRFSRSRSLYALSAGLPMAVGIALVAIAVARIPDCATPKNPIREPLVSCTSIKMGSISPLMAALSVSLCCHVKAIIQDEKGRRIGSDFLSNWRFREIPNGFYDENTGIYDDETGAPDPNPGCEIVLQGASSGTYTLRLKRTTSGKSFITLQANNLCMDICSIKLNDVPLGKGRVETFLIHHDQDNPLQFQVDLGSAGVKAAARKGRLLFFYKDPEVPREEKGGIRTVPIVLEYGEGIRPETFRADGNRRRITHLFHPKPGTIETVHLPLSTDEKQLEVGFIVQGVIHGYPAEERDAFTVGAH